MFNADYFSKHIITQIDELGTGSTSVTLHLNSGAEYRLQRINTAEPGYVLLSVYPPEGQGKKHRDKRRKLPDKEVFYDRVAIAYESITDVLLTIKDPEAGETLIGFQPGEQSAKQ
jgi:hypothetical protein